MNLLSGTMVDNLTSALKRFLSSGNARAVAAGIHNNY